MSKRDRIWYFLICIFLAASVAAVYWPVRNYDFLMYDDNVYVSENAHVTSGLSWENVRWAFTHGWASNWHPLTWISHMLDVDIYAMHPGGHHFTNLVIHAANTVLLFAIFEYMTGALWASAFIAAMFGLHPLHVESAAWVAERKDVLSTLFMILAMGAYAVYVRRGGIGLYIGVLVLFAIGLMAKPMLVTLPFVLLLLDFWPLERIRFGADDLEGGGIAAGVERKSLSYLIKEKIPFFVLSVISSVVTFIVQKSSGSVVPFEHFDLRIRLTNAATSYVAYIWKMIWPSRLAAFYPHQGDKMSIVAAFLCVILLVILTACFIYFGIRRKHLAVGWLWYVVMLLPVIGLVQVGGQSMADRYMYMPMTGLLIIITWGIWELTARLTQQKVLLVILAGGVLSASALVTANQIKYWQNSKTLFKRVIDVSPDAWYMHSNYANFLKDEGKVDEAIKHYRIAIGIKPDFAEAYCNMGNAFRKIDKLDEAVACYEKAIALKPDFADAHSNLGMVFAQMQKRDEAMAQFNKALELKPDDVEAISSIGLLYAEEGQLDKAVEYYRKAIAVDPAYVIAHGRLGLILGNQGKYDEALEQFRIVLKAKPDDAEMWRNSAILLEKLGKIDEAIEYYRKALTIKPDDAEVRRLLDAAIAKKEGNK